MAGFSFDRRLWSAYKIISAILVIILKGWKMKSFCILLLLCVLTGTAAYCIADNGNLVTPLQETKPKQGSQSNVDERLEKAIRAMAVDRIKGALKAGANPNLAKGTLSALRMALIYNNHNRKVKEEEKEETCLLVLNTLFNAGAKIQLCDKGILFHPVADGFPNIVELLINKGASPTAKMEGMTPIEWAESYGQQSVINVLMKYGGAPSSKKQAAQNRFVCLVGYSFERTAYSEQKNIIEMEKALEKGAAVDGKNSKGKTALVEATGPAAGLEEYVTVVYLLQKGANPNLKSAKHYSGLDGIALHYAVSFHGLMTERDGERKVYQRLVIEALLNADAHVSSRGHNGMTPLHISAKYNDIYAATILIKAGAKIMPKDDTGKTPLNYAESAEMIRLLKSHGAKEL